MTDSFETPPSGGFHLAQVDEPTNYGRLALRIVIALVISSLVVFIWVRFGHKTPVATGDIARIAIYPVQAKITGGAAGTPGEQGQDEIINQMLVFAHVRLHNPNKAPITIEDDWAIVTLPDGETRRSLGASFSDFEKVFQAYPQLAPMRMDPLRRDIEIPAWPVRRWLGGLQLSALPRRVEHPQIHAGDNIFQGRKGRHSQRSAELTPLASPSRYNQIMRQPEHIAIAGGGIIGLACALVLKDRGLQVTVFEADEAVREASWAAGGMLAAEDPENPPALLPFSRYSRSLYPSFLSQIERLSGHRVPLRTHETVQVLDSGRPIVAGIPLSHLEASRLVPGLAGSDREYLLLEEASLDPRELCTALRSAVTVAGVALHEYEPVLSAEAEGERVLLTTTRRVLEADSFVNCCGAWAASLHAVAAVAPSKGQMLVVTQPADSRLTRVLRSPDVYLIPRGQYSEDSARIIIGATVENAGYSREVDPAALSLLRRRAAALWPPVAECT